MARANAIKIGMVESAKLVNLIESEYSTIGKTDAEFAKYATEKLGFNVATVHVNNRRVALGIPSYREAKTKTGKADIGALQDLIAALERRITKLECNEVAMQNNISKLQWLANRRPDQLK